MLEDSDIFIFDVMTYFFFVLCRLGHRHGILCQEGSGARRVQLEQLRGEARRNGPKWLGSALQDVNWKDVRELAQAAGLRVRKDGTDTWLSVGELRAALLEHLAPQRSAAPEEFAVFFCVIAWATHLF